jgi:hypothetical protein
LQPAISTSEQTTSIPSDTKRTPNFYVSAEVNGTTETQVFENATEKLIREAFSTVQWDIAPSTEVVVETELDVIRISRNKSGDYGARWARDAGEKHHFQFWACDTISKDQALNLLLSLFVQDGRFATLVEWTEE